ncbi:MAG: phosphoribosylformylglycinamidine synthase subunit PurL [Thaumarchaeota archaeon]|nr:phosphoribosylformylglycinamidine synthase subunit PurL [Nitrososphaerota archaeon]
MTLTKNELSYIINRIHRDMTSTESHILNAEWSEHCSYKSSKQHLKPLQTYNLTSIVGHDSGIIEVGDGYVITAHIESHNHPSSIEPFGGASTGIGGVVRDILSSGTRPIALLDGLRFGNVENANTKWIFKNVVSGISHYGNCIGVPTIGGELEFDECYNDYALVDVMCIGLGKKKSLIKNRAKSGDLVILLGNFTGMDGIGGSQFASDSLRSQDDTTSAIQIPNPFIKKLIIEVIMELVNHNYIKAMKDLGGGGLSCAISEIAESLSIGITVDVDKIHTKQKMTPEEIMTSESQERMLLIIDKKKLQKIHQICKKFDLLYSIIGHVTWEKKIIVANKYHVVANLPIDLVVHPPLIDRESSIPRYIMKLKKEKKYSFSYSDLTKIFAKLIVSPNLANKNWVYNQYDYEVGLRTVVKPGYDAAVLKLDNKKYLSVSMDGNPKHCYLDPYYGTLGCFDEACRNIICSGSKLIGMVNHLQFGNPENKEIFWSFLKSLYGLIDYSKNFHIPCIGGKVSFYNETAHGQIKPSPVISMIGISDHPFNTLQIQNNDNLVIIGETKDELGGSEYFYQIFDSYAGKCPQVDFKASKLHMMVVTKLLKNSLVNSITDCSKGGIAMAISKLCMLNKIGCIVNVDQIPSTLKLQIDKILFSESHSRYIMAVPDNKLTKIISILRSNNVIFNLIGKFNTDKLIFKHSNNEIIKINIHTLYKKWMSTINELMI